MLVTSPFIVVSGKRSAPSGILLNSEAMELSRLEVKSLGILLTILGGMSGTSAGSLTGSAGAAVTE